VDADALNYRLSSITTLWSLVVQAHREEPVDAAAAARRRLMERYSGAVHRYLLGALRDPEAADEVFQEFALRFLRGAFRNADPQRGRFRDFVKTAVFHLIADHHKRQRARPQPLDPEAHAPAVQPAPQGEQDRLFLDSWRQELLERTWVALADAERQTGQPCYVLLRLRTEQPALSSAELAERLGSRLGKGFTIAALRQALYRAREKFVDLLLDVVASTLEDASAEALDQELIDLGLLGYSRSALARRKRG
jgi:RNA polymerase sigma-70 factor (ECF subfamily)